VVSGDVALRQNRQDVWLYLYLSCRYIVVSLSFG
jgi:hypothetical protein